MKKFVVKYNESYYEDYGDGTGCGSVGTKTIELTEEKLEKYIAKEKHYNDNYKVNILDVKIEEV